MVVTEKPWFFWQAGFTQCPPNTVHLKTIELPRMPDPGTHAAVGQMVPMEGATRARQINSLACPTLVKRPFAFQY
jgi:hypothetical protein